MTAAIEVQGLVKRYKETTALAGIDFSVPEGTVLGLLGPNGAGKTTAVRILSTLIKSDEGSATVFGMDVDAQADAVRSTIGLTGQYAAVDEYLTGFETSRWWAGSISWASLNPGPEQGHCWSGSTSPMREIGSPRRIPAACAVGSMSRRP